MSEPLRVVIVDDQALIRTGFTMILAAEGIDVVGEAANGLDAVEVVAATRPDVVLMDIRMPEMDGLEATRRILSRAGLQALADAGADVAAGPRVIMLTTFDLDRYVYAALSAGASGFLLKDVSPEHLVAAVQLVRSGDALLAPTITRRLVERYAAGAGRVDGANPANGATSANGADRVDPLRRDLSTLTPRELEVLRLLAKGLSNAEIAATFQLSEATVKTHVARILFKLSLRDRAQVVVMAYESGLVVPGIGGRTEHVEEGWGR